MDLSSKRILLTLFIEIAEWRRKQIVPSDTAKFRWSDLQLSIVRDYFINHSKTCDFRKLPLAKLFNRTFQYAGPGSSRICAKIAACFAQELKEFLMVPRLNKFLERENRIRKYQVLEAFVSFLLHLLYDKTDSIIDPCKDRIGYLEKELRFLLTILGDTSLMLCGDEHEEFQNLMAEFEAVANEAGGLLSGKSIVTLGDAVRRGPAGIMSSSAQELKNIFMVPRLRKFHGSQDRIKKYELVEAFISFLLRLLSHKTDSIVDPWKDRIGYLEKELRFLLTILGDISVMGCADEHEEFRNFMAEFEAVANEAGLLVHSLFFSTDDIQACGKMDEGIGVVLNNIDLFKARIMKFLNLLSSIRGSAYTAPQTSAVDSLHVIDSLIHDLKDLMKRDDNMIAFVKDQIKILHQGLVFLQSSVKDIGAPGPLVIEEMKEPLVRIGDMTYEAEYLIISFLVADVPLWYLMNRLTDVNSKIEHFGNELQQITKKYKLGGLKFVKNISSELLLPEKRNNEVDDVIVGFEDEAKYILDKLVGGGTERLQVISVFGMPGLGKTTLARKLYNHPLVNYVFDKLSWCVISQTYRRQNILVNILSHIKSDNIGKDKILEMKEEILVEHIYRALKGRRFLIVMDDIWDLNVWDDLRRCFPDDGNGSRIFFTSRNKDVAPPNSIIYALPSLTNDQCWELLVKKVFGNKSCPPELLGIGKRIAANCFGLPLAVVVIAGVLSTLDKEKSTWEEVGGNLASYIFDGQGNSVMQVLELSYKHLPYYLKPCFLCFGALQAEKEIHVRHLIRLWIAEGFVRKEDEKSAENIGEEYLMELIDKSLVMVAKRRSDGGARACVLHDLWRELCFKKSREENFLKSSDNCGYSIHVKGVHMQALYLSGSSSYRQHFYLLRDRGLISPFCVHDMRLFRVLGFDFVDTYLIDIGYMVNLRYLIISNLPASIGSLVNLEYLCVKTDVRVDLPPAIATMMKLRYIDVGSEATYDKYCSSSQTNNLEFLSRFIISESKDEEMLKCSPHLRKLKCNIEADQYFDLGFFTQLESLNVRFKIVGKQKIRLPSNIKKLTLSGSMLLLEMMSIIGRLGKLEVLKLDFDAFEGEKWYTMDGEFQKLRFLKLRISHLPEWYVFSSGHFPRLQQLVLVNCCNLHEIPSEIGEIPTLQLIEVKGRCQKSLVESAKRIQQEQLDMGNEELMVIIT